MPTLAIPVTLLQLAATAIAAAAANIALPGCQSKCGELDIPYPFGTTAGCYRPGFKVTCNPKPGAGVAQRLMLGDAGGPVVLEISVPNSTVRIRSNTWFFAVGNTSMTRLAVVPAGGPFVLRPGRNRLVYIGCGFRASSWTPLGARAFNACSTSCWWEDDTRRIRSGRCDGVDCCNASIPTGLTSFRTQFQWAGEETGTPATSPCTSSGAAVVVVEKRWLHFRTNVLGLMMSLLAFGRASVLVAPAILDWAFDNSSTCAEATKRSVSGCVSKHSECVDSAGGALGYGCKCGEGYQGNPYVRDGCQRPSRHLHLSAGESGHLMLVFLCRRVKDDTGFPMVFFKGEVQFTFLNYHKSLIFNLQLRNWMV